MLLTMEKFERIASAAREDLRKVLLMIAMHEELLADRRRADFLNAPTALLAAAAWERFATDLVGASLKADWRSPGDWDRRPSPAWPDTTRDHDGTERLNVAVLQQRLDRRLLEHDTLDAPLTASWQVWAATSWFGRRPTEWFLLDGSSPVKEQSATLQSLMLSAKSARDAAAHGLLDKKAVEAGDHYWWMSDNDGRARLDGSQGGPSIQSGYCRGVAALFVQLVDCSITAVVRRNGWSADCRLPPAWFKAVPRDGTRLHGLELWGGEALHRVP